MTALLDTNACIAIMNDRPQAARVHARQAHERGETLAVSSISLFELWYGVAKSERVEANTSRLAEFLAPLYVVPFDVEDARVAGDIRAALERKGRPIGSYDGLIAGQAVRHGLLLVTANVGEFSRVEGLHWQDWSA